ncbi:hypothetical protein BpHYR1_025190 [Brachionus plicatilis]|uniref:Uncharacterized protein n=1 Tax=Brachionus plicatilis TaxID=10195 RepID=A0A3M7SPD0_BRAPC|nr:hypothetical protein BpHYR1_025190 [Brachionus plicatilis]
MADRWHSTNLHTNWEPNQLNLSNFFRSAEVILLWKRKIYSQINRNNNNNFQQFALKVVLKVTN